MTTKITLVALVTCALIVAAGCRDCTLMYVQDMLVVHLDADDWTDGEWVVEVETYGDHNETMRRQDTLLRCVVTLPHTGDETTLACNDDMSELNLTDDGSGIISIVMESAAIDVDVTVIHDDTSHGTQSFEPEYDTDEPNGEGCGFCYDGDVTYSI